MLWVSIILDFFSVSLHCQTYLIKAPRYFQAVSELRLTEECGVSALLFHHI